MLGPVGPDRKMTKFKQLKTLCPHVTSREVPQVILRVPILLGEDSAVPFYLSFGPQQQ